MNNKTLEKKIERLEQLKNKELEKIYQRQQELDLKIKEQQ